MGQAAFVCVGRSDATEAFADDFRRSCNGDEGVGVGGANKIAQQHGLFAAENRGDDPLGRTGLGADGVVNGCAAVKGFGNIVLDGGVLIRYYHYALARVDAVDHHVHQRPLDQQSQDAVQSGFYAEDQHA